MRGVGGETKVVSSLLPHFAETRRKKKGFILFVLLDRKIKGRRKSSLALWSVWMRNKKR